MNSRIVLAIILLAGSAFAQKQPEATIFKLELDLAPPASARHAEFFRIATSSRLSTKPSKTAT